MITVTKAYNPAAAMAHAKARNMTFNTSTVAAYIRHQLTDYDTKAVVLGTDEAEAFIMSVVKTVVEIEPMTKSAMIRWAQAKIKTLA